MWELINKFNSLIENSRFGTFEGYYIFASLAVIFIASLGWVVIIFISYIWTICRGQKKVIEKIKYNSCQSNFHFWGYFLYIRDFFSWFCANCILYYVYLKFWVYEGDFSYSWVVFFVIFGSFLMMYVTFFLLKWYYITPRIRLWVQNPEINIKKFRDRNFLVRYISYMIVERFFMKNYQKKLIANPKLKKEIFYFKIIFWLSLIEWCFYLLAFLTFVLVIFYFK